jgi:hypothetical protein
LARPLVSELTSDNTPVSVLNSAECSEGLEEGLSDPVSILRNELCSCRLEDEVNEPASVLKNERCPTRAEDRPNEPDRLLTKPLTSDPVRNNEPVKPLDSAM